MTYGSDWGDMSAIIALADVIPDMGALSIVNVMGNNIGKEMLSKIMHSKPNLVSLCGIADDATEADLSGLDMDADDAIILASELPDKGAMTSLNISNNNIGKPDELPEGWSYGLKKGYTSIYEYKHADGRKQDDPPAGSKSSGLTALADAIKDMGVILSVNLLKNSIGVDQAKDLVIILKEHPTLKSLCGNKGNETELDMSRKMGGTEDAIMLAAEVVDNGALTKFDISKNEIRAEAGKALAAGLKGNQVITELIIVDNQLVRDADFAIDMSGIIALADVIPDMGALSTFTFSGDYSSSQPITMETTMTEADFSGKELGVSGGMMVAAFLPKCQ
jgi:hypothetical protein